MNDASKINEEYILHSIIKFKDIITLININQIIFTNIK